MTSSTTDPAQATMHPAQHRGRFERLVGVIPLGIGPRLAPLFAGDGLKARAMRGSAWTIAGYGAQQVLRLGSNLILTRLLFPEAFGLMALVQVFMQGLAMFSDVGIGPSIIQNKRGDDPAFLNTAWTIQVIRGFILWLVACAIAWPVAQFYNEPMLAQMLPVAGLSAVIAGFNTTKIFTANRHLALGRLTTVELTSQILGLIAIVSLAWWMRSVWALVYGSLIGGTIKTALAHIALPGATNWFRWDRSATKQLFSFGKWIFISTVCTFFGIQIDKLVLGRLLTIDQFGMYAIAGVITLIPQNVLGQLVQKVALPAMARLNLIEDEASRIKFEKSRLKISVIMAIGYAVIFSFVDILVDTLWDVRYKESGWMAGAICAGLLPLSIFSLNVKALLSQGLSQYQAYGNFSIIVSAVAGCFVGYAVAGYVGVIWGISLSHFIPMLISVAMCSRHNLTYFKQDMFSVAVFVIFAVVLVCMRVMLIDAGPAWLYTGVAK